VAEERGQATLPDIKREVHQKRGVTSKEGSYIKRGELHQRREVTSKEGNHITNSELPKSSEYPSTSSGNTS
jgi:hypothetical protein